MFLKPSSVAFCYEIGPRQQNSGTDRVAEVAMPDESGRGSSLAQRGLSHSALPIHAAGHGQGLLRPRGLARKPHAALAGARPATPAPQPDGACRCAPPFPLGIRPVLPHEKVGETLTVKQLTHSDAVSRD